MLIPKEQFKNTVISIKVGNATIQIKAEDITQKHIEAYKNHVDLTYFVEECNVITSPIIEAFENAERLSLFELQEENRYNPEKHDAKNIIQEEIDRRLDEAPKKRRTRKKK